MPARLTSEFIQQAVSETAWDFGNRVLYDLCAANPGHARDDIIIAKVWLIGRSYAAAIERRPIADGAIGDAFYETVVAPKIRCSDIDNWFRELGTCSNTDVGLILEMHTRVMRLFNEISGLEKRSLASKYLHFHFPERFYIYDGRANDAIKKLTKRPGKNLPPLRGYDNEYARFFVRCQNLNEQMASLVGRHLLPREFDKVLLAYRRSSSMIHESSS